MPFLGLMGCKRFIQLSKGAVVRLKVWRRLQSAGTSCRIGPLCSAPLDFGREAADPSAESTAARVGDGMAEWSACERIADVATVGPGGAPFRAYLAWEPIGIVRLGRDQGKRDKAAFACFGRGRGWSLWTLVFRSHQRIPKSA